MTSCTVAHQASLSFTISWSLLKLMSIESVMPSNYLILCRPLLLLSSIFPSIRVFSNDSAICISWPTYWRFRFSFSISPSNEHSRLISFRSHLFDLLVVQGTLKSLFQHHNSKAPILQLSVVHPTLSSSVIPFSFCLQSSLVSGSLPMSWLFASHGQSTGVSALSSFLPKNTQG